MGPTGKSKTPLPTPTDGHTPHQGEQGGWGWGRAWPLRKTTTPLHTNPVCTLRVTHCLAWSADILGVGCGPARAGGWQGRCHTPTWESRSPPPPSRLPPATAIAPRTTAPPACKHAHARCRACTSMTTSAQCGVGAPSHAPMGAAGRTTLLATLLNIASEVRCLARLLSRVWEMLVRSSQGLSRALFSTAAAAKQRPLSPHLQIYKLPFNAMTSVGFRATGILLTFGEWPGGV
jgi:hypothetical protein